MTAIGKLYKPGLRAMATRAVLEDRLARLGLDAEAGLAVEATSRGVFVRFETAAAGTQTRIRAMMAPFALDYAIEPRPTRETSS